MTKRVSFGNVWHQVSNSMLIAVETHVGRDTVAVNTQKQDACVREERSGGDRI